MRRGRHPVPILSDEVNRQIVSSIQSFANRGLWAEWGLNTLREQGVAILLYGEPGTGKTISAYHIGKQLKLAIKEVSVADYGSRTPGQLARNINHIFHDAIEVAKQNNHPPPIILMDECDAMLVDRQRLGPDMMWMLEPINCLLAEIGRYPGLVILVTNLEPYLDAALKRRLLTSIKFNRPGPATRVKLWQSKWPSKFPVLPNEQEIEELAMNFDLTGAEIESEFILWAGSCIADQQEPRVADLLEYLYRKYGTDHNRRAAARDTGTSALDGSAIYRADASRAVS